jgi:hypothetical protein
MSMIDGAIFGFVGAGLVQALAVLVFLLVGSMRD